MRERTSAKPGFDYQVPRTNNDWPEHILRTNITGGIIAWLKPDWVVDPACGDASVLRAAHGIRSIPVATLGDISAPSINQTLGDRPPQWRFHVGPIEETMRRPVGMVDVMVLTEVLEHLEDPVAILKLARQKARNLVASSPEMRPGQIDSNPEHLWQFDGDGFLQMLAEAGWNTIGTKVHIHFESQYNFQIWVAQ